MRKKVLILTILVIVLQMYSCQKQQTDDFDNIIKNGMPFLKLDQNSFEFSSESGSQTFWIHSNISWMVSSDADWCNVNPVFGNKDGRVTVNVEENTSSTSRIATITVETSRGTMTLKVKQEEATSPSSQVRIFTVGDVKFKMIAIEGGTFTMGATPEQGSDARRNEFPVHSVTLSNYRIGETEVTQALWKAVMGRNPSDHRGNNRPVEHVLWDDCQEFITKLNTITGEHFRLPTEAEWEFAARGGNLSIEYKYSGSNTIDDIAWYHNNTNSKTDCMTHNVATKQPNELGIYDMSGNVEEWCSDWYRDGYDSSAQTNPTGPSTGFDRVVRGGFYYSGDKDCRVSYRCACSPSYKYYIGFRLAL